MTCKRKDETEIAGIFSNDTIVQTTNVNGSVDVIDQSTSEIGGKTFRFVTIRNTGETGLGVFDEDYVFYFYKEGAFVYSCHAGEAKGALSKGGIAVISANVTGLDYDSFRIVKVFEEENNTSIENLLVSTPTKEEEGELHFWVTNNGDCDVESVDGQLVYKKNGRIIATEEFRKYDIPEGEISEIQIDDISEDYDEVYVILNSCC